MLLDRLPDELVAHILAVGDFSPRDLHVLSRQVTKVPTRLATAACRPSLWRPYAKAMDLLPHAVVPLDEAFAQRFANKDHGARRALAKLATSDAAPLCLRESLEEWAQTFSHDFDLGHAICRLQPDLFPHFDAAVRGEPSLAARVFDDGRGAAWLTPCDLLQMHRFASQGHEPLARRIAANRVWLPWSRQQDIDAADHETALFSAFYRRWAQQAADRQEELALMWESGKRLRRDSVTAQDFEMTTAEHEFYEFDAALALCLIAPQCLEDVVPMFQQDRNFALQVMNAGGGRFFAAIAPFFADDAEVAFSAVSHWGLALQLCSERIRGLPSVARAAYLNDEQSAAFFASTLRCNRTFVAELFGLRPSEALARWLSSSSPEASGP